jgi:hypothetical protein
MQEAEPVPKADQDIKGIQYIGKASILSEWDTAEVPLPPNLQRRRGLYPKQ